MKPNQHAKSLGCESLAKVSELTGVSNQTLSNWHKNKPALFEVVCLGVVHLTKEKDCENE